MSGRLEGKVAFITGAARGQGRSHAIRMAEEGAAIIATDICAQIDSVPYPLGTSDDLAETVRAVTALGAPVVSAVADVRDRAALQAAFDDGVAQLGPVDIVVANAGVWSMAVHEHPATFQDTLDINLTGVYNTVEVAAPSMVERKQGGAIVLISSTAGLAGISGGSPAGLGYAASKHGVVGLMRNYANTLAPHSIRVNSVHPTGVETPMINNSNMEELIAEKPELMNAISNALPIAVLRPLDIANAVLWLVSDEALYVTGVALPVDGGLLNGR